MESIVSWVMTASRPCRRGRSRRAGFACAVLLTGALGGSVARAQVDAPTDLGWPRLYTVSGGAEVILHQPQVDEWRDFESLFIRLAVEVTLKGAKEPSFGVTEFNARTTTDHEARLVTLYDTQITALRFPQAAPDALAALEAAVRDVPAAKSGTVVSLDRILAYLDANRDQDTGVAVNLDPPPIFYSDKEAILVSFLGEPRFSPIEGNPLEFGLNTNWDLLRDPATGLHYLLYNEAWLQTADLMKGPWTATKSLPKAFKSLPKDEAWDRVSKSVPGKKLKKLPAVFVCAQPAEVILTKGRPKFESIPGTQLAQISNSDNTLFYHQGEANFYFMAAGRWFRAHDLSGPWSAATTTLPADFAQIPRDHPAAEILASVPGTYEANDAILIASIPKTGVVNRMEAQPEVSFDGEPEFVPIETSTVEYAANTPNDVFKVGEDYYCCYQAVWFMAPSTSGPWVVTDVVPAEIYEIPPTSPKYHVTYVTVVESTPTTVVCAHTSGYEGEVVSNGVVMFGLGMLIGAALASDHYYYGYYPPYYWGYGPRPYPYYGHYHYYVSPYGHAWAANGPYGGYGYGAKYNPNTGIYARGGYAYGPGGGAGWRAGYNPDTGLSGAQRGGYNAYGAWRQTAVTNGNDWVRGGSATNGEGTAGRFATSGGAAGVGYRGEEGSGYIVKDKYGNVYAGKDGNVYKRDEDGNWTSPEVSTNPSNERSEARASTGQRPTTQPSQTTPPAKPTTTDQARPTTKTTSRGTGTDPAVQTQLNSAHSARQRGDAAATSRTQMGGRGRGGGRRG